jgi:hypothetical protein
MRPGYLKAYPVITVFGSQQLQSCAFGFHFLYDVMRLIIRKYNNLGYEQTEFFFIYHCKNNAIVQVLVIIFSIILASSENKYLRTDMNNAEIAKDALQRIKSAAGSRTGYELFLSEKPSRQHKHEFLFFIKPEIMLIQDHTRLEALFLFTFDTLSRFGLHIKDMRLFEASYLDKYDIIAQHYGVINALSRQPLLFMSAEARSKFKALFGRHPEKVSLLGSLQFLQHFTSFSPESLEKLWQETQSVKLAGGTYCARVNIEGQEIFLINGFHPRQLIHFTAKGRSIVAFTLTGNLDWSVARNHFIGKTNPAEAIPGSLRNALLIRKDEFGLSEVSASKNGFHLSAGPVEGLVELIRYCSDYSSGQRVAAEEFVFGKQLKDHFNGKTIEKICGNQMVDYHGSRISTFDLTEERNSEDAIQLLKECNIGD